MSTLLLILMLLIAVLLILVVLVQPGKGDMLSGMGGLGGTFSNVLGTRKATDFLTKLTIGLAAALLVFSIAINKFFLQPAEDVIKPAVEGAPVPTTTAPPATPLQMPEQQPQENQDNGEQQESN
jgi:preprotein translocase subunit SecG